jgi:spoIIIJ-associated protein
MTITSFLTNLCKHSGIDEAAIAIESNEESSDETILVNVNLPEEDSGLFIGFHGETLNAVQRLTRLVFQDKYPDRKILININEYREQREEKLRAKAQQAAERVLASGRPYVFEGLSSPERFIIHTAISEHAQADQLESFSEGEGRNRVLTVRLKAE